MQGRAEQSRTMFIKFPTVMKLQYPIQLVREGGNHTSYRQNFVRRSMAQPTVLSKTQSFKIIKLPERGQIMNICTMTVRERQDESGQEIQKGRIGRRKIFSVAKLSSLKIIDGDQPTFKNPFKIKKQSSVKSLRRVSICPTVKFDYFQVYSQFVRLIGFSWGVVISGESAAKIRRGKIDLSNNGFLVKQILKKRLWWNVVSQEVKREEGEGVNFIWTPHILPKNQMEQLVQMNQHCISQEVSEESREKLSFQRNFDAILSQTPKIQQLFFTQWQQTPSRFKDWLKQLQSQPLLKLTPDNLTISNHLSNHWQITNKKLLYLNMVNYYKFKGIDPYSKIPRTYHITCFNWQEIIRQLRGQQRTWILKPGQFTNRGRGISVFLTTKQALDYILFHPPRIQQKTFLLQQYINPLLYQQRKFDIRCYMLGIEVGQILKFYMYEQGYIRTASQKFTLKRVSKSVHLTNDAIQKNMPNYDKYESANKLSYGDMDKYCLNNTTFNFNGDIVPEIRRITRDICHAVGDGRLIGAGRGVGFQLFGLDYLVDGNGRPWLCQVNTNPSLQICCSLLSRIIPEMLENTFRLVNDIFYPPKKTPEYAQHFLTNNKYSLIYSNSTK